MSRWGQGGGVPARIRRLVLERDGYRCQLRLFGYCSGRAEEVDHTVSLGTLGIHRRDPRANDPNLLAAVCIPCHRRKSQREALEATRKYHADRASRLRLPQRPHPGDFDDEQEGGDRGW